MNMMKFCTIVLVIGLMIQIVPTKRLMRRQTFELSADDIPLLNKHLFPLIETNAKEISNKIAPYNVNNVTWSLIDGKVTYVDQYGQNPYDGIEDVIQQCESALRDTEILDSKMELAAFSPIPRRPDHLGKQLMITDLLVKAENATTLSEYLTLTVETRLPDYAEGKCEKLN